MKKVGFVSILGRPNTGKSTLINAIMKTELSIITPTPQTTRDRIKGIYNDDESQIIFIDTPGIHKPVQKLGDSLNNRSYMSIQEADINLFLSPINEEIGKGDELILQKLLPENTICIISKIDLSNESKAKGKAQEFKDKGFQNVLGVSSEWDTSIVHLITFLKERLKEGHPFYEDEWTDKSTSFFIKEIIRESIINNTSDEVPYSVGVLIRNYDNTKKMKNVTIISANIYVARESQKGIIIGKNGSMIKTIGTSSRIKIENMLGEKIFLDLSVKVMKNWYNKLNNLEKLGY